MSELEHYREEIDRIDEKLISLLGQRFQIVQAVGEYKTRTNTEIVQTQRAEQVKEQVQRLAEQNGLHPQFVKSLYEMMIDHAHEIEHRIKADHETA